MTEICVFQSTIKFGNQGMIIIYISDHQDLAVTLQINTGNN